MLFTTRHGPSAGLNARRKASMTPRGFFRAIVLRKSNANRNTNPPGIPSVARVHEGSVGGRTIGCGNVNTGLSGTEAATAARVYSLGTQISSRRSLVSAIWPGSRSVSHAQLPVV